MVCFVGKFSDELFYILTFKKFFEYLHLLVNWGDSQIKTYGILMATLTFPGPGWIPGLD